MSIQGIHGYGLPGFIPTRPRPGGAEELATDTAPAHAPEHAPARQPTASGAAGQGALAAEAPQGTDPALWNVLTSEERAFFARARAMGPLTYGPGASSDAPGVSLGGRIDLRV